MELADSDLRNEIRPRNYVIWFALVVTAIAASVPFWPTITASIGMAHLGDQIAASGLILSTGGFGVTIWQLLRTSNATAAAAVAIESLHFRLRIAEEAQLCRDCLNFSSEIERLHFLAATQPALVTFIALPERYRSLRLSLIELRARRNNFWSAKDKQVLQEVVARLTDTEKTIIRYIGNGDRPLPRVAPLNSSVQHLSALLTTLSVGLNALAIGDTNDRR